ncbi:UBP-type zinc finger domain-containing protein [Streptomyces sp. NPDC058385]|uniref:UBP-type zinc finger domain-containing protein n=1 Tax=Streptomyces sp. NPDC058385 TaxID=3346473 RepID=UPI00366935F9
MTGWRVAFDAGRPQGRACLHAKDAPLCGPVPVSTVCAGCLEEGTTWVHLRLCLTCGHVGCCDSSRRKHAAAHAQKSGHAVARSIEKGEMWAWCYEDELFLTQDGDRPEGADSPAKTKGRRPNVCEPGEQPTDGRDR